jgi:AcrR family transcriptional regulator
MIEPMAEAPQPADLPVQRVDRRKVRSRAALVAAGQRLLAEGHTKVSTQEITDTAKVGFGTFYNHFDTKEQLFGAALGATLEDWGVLRDAAVAELEDPAEIFARSFRMAGRLRLHVPQAIKVILNSGIVSILRDDRALKPRAAADIAAGIDQGRFTLRDPELAVTLTSGALMGLLAMLDADPSLDDAKLTDIATERVLVMLGISEDEAHDLAHSSFPDIPQG